MVGHFIKEQSPGSAPGTCRYKYWCGIELDNVAPPSGNGVPSENVTSCPDCAEAKAKENEG